MRLARLTAMERDKIINDYGEIVGQIVEHLALLADPEKIKTVIVNELKALKKNFPRREKRDC